MSYIRQFYLLLVLTVGVFAQEDESLISNSSTLIIPGDRFSFFEWLFGSTTTEAPPPTEIPTKCDSCTCGLTNKNIRIVGGHETQVNQYPWMALLKYHKQFYCGASLINHKYLLTASHCVDGFQRTGITAILLEHKRDSTSESITISRKISHIIMHSGYDRSSFNNDIALLRLNEPLPLDKNIRPVCLPPKGRSFTGEKGIVTGWGVTGQGGSPSQTLREVEVPIMSNTDCKKTAYGPRKITDNMICAGYREGQKDSCQGDSGGPLHMVNSTIHHVIGVVSWGEGCARPNYPGVYSRVNRYLTWIEKNTRDACPCSPPPADMIASLLTSADWPSG